MNQCARVLYLVLLMMATATSPGALPTGSNFTTGFPTLAEIMSNASLLSEELFVTHDGERRSYNHMGFSCDGDVTKLTYIALPGSGTDHIVFEIQGSGPESDTTSTSTASKFGAYGYHLASDMSFRAGDTFLVDANQQAPSSRLLYRIGEQSHTVCWSWMDDNLRCELDRDYPLLAVETDPPGCAYGFMEEEDLRSEWINKADAILHHTPEKHIDFNCIGPGYLSKWMIGAYIRDGNEDMGAELEIHTTEDTTTIHRCDLTTLQATLHANVYECVIDPPVEVNVGDYVDIHMRNTKTQVCYLHSGDEETALLSVSIEGLCSPFSNGFSTESNLIEQARLIPNFAEIENNTLIFQHMNFTQDGILTNLKFAAVEFGTGNGRNRFPKLQVYEPDAEEGYILRYNISLANATQTDHPHVYKLAVTPLRYIRAGSIVGFFQPPKSEAQFLLSYLRNAGPPAQSAYAMQSSTVEPYPGKEGPLPLVALEIIPPPPVTTSSTTVDEASVTPSSVSIFSLSTSDSTITTTNAIITMTPTLTLSTTSTSTTTATNAITTSSTDTDVTGGLLQKNLDLITLLVPSISGLIIIALICVVTLAVVCASRARKGKKRREKADSVETNGELTYNQAYVTPNRIKKTLNNTPQTHQPQTQQQHREEKTLTCSGVDPSIDCITTGTNTAYDAAGYFMEHEYDVIVDRTPRGVRINIPLKNSETVQCVHIPPYAQSQTYDYSYVTDSPQTHLRLVATAAAEYDDLLTGKSQKQAH